MIKFSLLHSSFLCNIFRKLFSLISKVFFKLKKEKGCICFWLVISITNLISSSGYSFTSEHGFYQTESPQKPDFQVSSFLAMLFCHFPDCPKNTRKTLKSRLSINKTEKSAKLLSFLGVPNFKTLVFTLTRLTGWLYLI